MAVHVTCPKCAASVESVTGEATPSRCTVCGARLTCPGCGKLLEPDTAHGGSTLCRHCGLQMEGTETLPRTDGAPTRGRESLLLPGFEIHGELGRGGMGVVYAATQVRLGRQVALKVLPPILAADPIHLDRFRNEARITANLVKSHVLPIFDVLDAQGVPVLVLPLIKGTTLGRIVRDRQAVREGTTPEQPHPWAMLDDRAYLSRMLPLLDQVVDAVTAIHQAQVLHRDIKPSNILVDERGEAWLSDFGLARLEKAGVGTSPGMAVGTRGYMSPEQARGEEIDGRADVFSLGVTLYQALTLHLPYAKDGSDTVATPPSRQQPLLSRDYDAVLLKALAVDRGQRYASATELRDDWRSVRQGLLPKAVSAGPVHRLARRLRRYPWTVAGALVIIVLGALLGGALLRGTPDQTVYRTVNLETKPLGARVVLVPLDPDTGEPLEEKAIRPEERTPLTLKRVPVGRCLVVAELPGHGFHEVYRLVPGPDDEAPVSKFLHQYWAKQLDGSINLPGIKIPMTNVLEGMAYFEGGRFTMGSNALQGVPPHQRKVAAFYLDPSEVSVAAFQKALGRLPIALADKKLPANEPITFVNFHEALHCAEVIGKRLPDEAEYEFAATRGGTQAFPWGDAAMPLQDPSWWRGPVREPNLDRTNTSPPVFGLYSNVVEWTSTWNDTYPGERRMPKDIVVTTRILRGGQWPVITREPDLSSVRFKGPRHREATYIDRSYPGLGFRCARSAAPRFLDAP